MTPSASFGLYVLPPTELSVFLERPSRASSVVAVLNLQGVQDAVNPPPLSREARASA